MLPMPEDNVAICDLMARYCLTLDLDDVDGWVSLYTPDGTFSVYGRSFDGHERLRGMATAAPGGLHLGGSPVIEMVDENTARTTRNLLFVERGQSESRCAVYADRLRRTAEGWRIAATRCRFIVADGMSDRPARRHSTSNSPTEEATMHQAVRRLMDDLAIQRLMATYCQCVDDARFAEAASLFTGESVFDYGGRRWVGQDAIVSFLEEFQVPERRGRHSCMTPVVDYDGDGGARAVTDFVFFGKADGGWLVKFVGRYHDTLRAEADGWRLQERRVVLIDPAG